METLGKGRGQGFAVAVLAGVGWVPAVVWANSLSQLYELAQQNDQTLQIAAHQRDVAREAAPQARAPLFPQLTAEADARYNKFHVVSASSGSSYTLAGAVTDQSYASTGYTVTLSQTIFDWSAFSGLSAAENAVAQADASYASAQQNLILRLVGSYFGVLQAQDYLQADQDLQNAYKHQLDQAQETFKSGVAPLTDLKNAQAAYDSSRASVTNDLTALSNARRALAVLVGAPVDRIARLRDDIALVPPSPADAESWSRTALSNNPDVIAARFGAAAADRQVSATWGKHLPTLNLVGQVAGDNTRNSVFGANVMTDYVGVNLKWNLFQGGLIASSVREAEANSRRLASQHELQRRIVDRNVRDDFDGVVNGIAAVNAATSAVSSQQASVLATEVGFKVGIRTIIDLINARQTLNNAQKTLAQARYQYLVSLLSLKSDVGQLTQKDLDDVDRMLVGGNK